MCKYIDILKREVVPAEGCTEPIAVAYAVSLASEQIKGEIKQIQLYLSANIIKNALGVGIPGTGKIGIEIAAALGGIIKKSEKKLEILSNFTKDELEKANEIVNNKVVKISQKYTEEKLYIEAIVRSDNEYAKVVISREHTNIILIEKNDNVLYKSKVETEENIIEDSDELSVEKIYKFATTADFNEIKFILNAVPMNKKVSNEGLKGGYGLQVGNKISSTSKFNLLTSNAANQIIAATAAASDARMDGCTMPIMTTGGSGNQGIACTMPVIELGSILKKSDEDLARALIISNLITIHLKEYMGRLSPLCGAGIAGATGACCGMTYLQGGSLENIKRAINNMLADLSGLICDGAKTTCALKIATATNAAIQCSTLAMNNISPSSKDGIVFDDVEETIKNIAKLVKEGLANTDNTILSIMLAK
ncbi:MULTISPECIES: L-serine ammonia-lyase, iron-sulfur-dependent, subunit alpha [Clostridium]|uniref:L-cysteine desulfidase family protein n=1 Tax=Clostridium TaxID=1485 RepID=UPI00290361B5|nr:L-serine ammonia-lyase, iron-sulfur-dependent, subunit alpha [Clostridium sp.]MDU1824219.1 L-serine ammonia-lyase, iron-sulfur-dependent, subunit alpha [Clostridium sp.]MDU1842200.1 L-serine ammonia-lyase, iron-sulfur-dependent, subunit alpha [Clostridium sp.]MDU2691126.1 L-serine ammonia-lyase, iron-sulfur-dependent, subunit alpha [Clostridium sp.]MDU2957174.1 L-serine ammonia-lyase, iron-sulfur-dependent, subunit alpha [Clostridium sp.]MDU3108397.1 L-serine ammonia-lyase, iron-sulfur-depe